MMQILNDRETRVALINSLTIKYQQSIICLRANYPGSNKNNNITTYVIKEVYKNLNIKDITYETSYFNSEGLIYLIVINDNSLILKEKMIKFEESFSLGRLVDIDVYDYTGKSISRNDFKIEPRSCFICSSPAHYCIRSQKHNIDLVQTFYHNQVWLYYLSNNISHIVYEALIKEVSLPYKFGLVTKISNGSHTDMNYDLFKKSAKVISLMMPLFIENVIDNEDINTIYSNARKIGLKVEEAMFLETNGINTHKGFIFLCGVYLTSLSYALKKNDYFNNYHRYIKLIFNGVLDDINKLETNGINAYNKLHTYGIRSHINDEFAFINERYLSYLNCDNINNYNSYHLLIETMLLGDDTTLYKRLNYQNIDVFKNKYQYLLNKDYYTNDELRSLESDFIKDKLSIGGCADILSIVYILENINKIEVKFNG